MGFLLKAGAYIFHPLLMPVMGTLLYYQVSPRFIEPELRLTKIFAVAIITFFIPVISFFLLRNLRLVESIHLRTVKERKFPLMINCLLILLIVKLVFDPYQDPELYYFFVAILFTTITALILVMLKFKVSLHQMGIAGVTFFLIGLSVHFQVNMLVWIGFNLFANGWVASSRLYTRSHTYPELIIGFFVGAIPQLTLMNFWL
ncbi:hypothetical protein [Aureitalea marina]|uniref:Uncharacterized protein n=1 Tax=Aureitalea marina TaxID=930804 RepID=A0A2S7KRH4_9FLAO|nr:hypothetical protein [Aureitalea marina]PQB05197.1 hypothetical protein BST85_10110 [Aureitalea marina]